MRLEDPPELALAIRRLLRNTPGRLALADDGKRRQRGVSARPVAVAR